MKQEYITYQAQDFLEVESFIQAYLHGDPGLRKAWEDWATAHPECQPQLREGQKLIAQLAVKDYSLQPGQKEKIWQHIQDSITTTGILKRPARRIPLKWYSVAAACLFLVATLMVWLQVSGQSRITSMAGTHLTHVLPDESQVVLNAASQINYRTRTYASKRNLHLDGEAFFEVKKGAPFTVQTDLGTVRVWGTSFNVFSRDSIFNVKCFTGKVEVTIPGRESVFLTPGESIAYIRGHDPLADSFDPQRQEDWRSGIVNIDDLPLSNVFAEIERQYDVNITFGSDTGNKHYTGFFQLNQLDSALYHVCWPMQLKYQIDGKQITIE